MLLLLDKTRQEKSRQIFVRSCQALSFLGVRHHGSLLLLDQSLEDGYLDVGPLLVAFRRRSLRHDGGWLFVAAVVGSLLLLLNQFLEERDLHVLGLISLDLLLLLGRWRRPIVHVGLLFEELLEDRHLHILLLRRHLGLGLGSRNSHSRGRFLTGVSLLLLVDELH